MNEVLGYTPQQDGERLQKFLAKTGFEEIRRNNDDFESLLQNMSYDEFKKHLVQINGMLRKIPKNERGFYEKDMFVGALIAPSNEIQNRVLEKGFKAIKQIADNKARGVLAYYLINDLHLFGDGNGRTSRLMYEILSNQDFDAERDFEKFVHDKDDFSMKGGKNFEQNHDFAWIQTANKYAGQRVFSDLVESGELPDDERLTNKSGVRTRNGRVFETNRSFSGYYLTADAQENLTDEEKKLVGRALLDNNTQCTVGGLTMAIMTNRKGTIGRCIEKNEQEIAEVAKTAPTRADMFIFNIGNDDEDEDYRNFYGAETFVGWTADDYREAVQVAERIKEAQLDKLIDFFVHPSKYQINKSGQTLADELLTIKP